ncbi:three-Cys-motif partner protein TcmP [Patescibacteria group bacterium]|nr:three-Cys-motif partner protein TcmP [Patescibacteria group bacterium]
MSDNLWDITDKPHTKTKLEILHKVFDVWLTIWNAPKQNWVSKEWYVIDLFAGRGLYTRNRELVSGSPLIFLEEILKKADKLIENTIKLKLFYVECDNQNYEGLVDNVNMYIEKHPKLRDVATILFYKDDCNKIIDKIIPEMKNNTKNPMFVFIDPYGLHINKLTIEKLANMKNPKDIILNYMLEGVRRVWGVASKKVRKKKLSVTEMSTIKKFEDYFGSEVEDIPPGDLDMLKYYCRTLTEEGLRVVRYEMRHPIINDSLYYLLFAAKNANITGIVRKIYLRERKNDSGQSPLPGFDPIVTLIPNG